MSLLLTSAKTGVAPVYNTELAVATNVIFGIITSSPIPISRDLRDRWSADVAFDTPIAYFEPVNLHIAFSNFRKIGPSVNKLDFRAISIACLS